MSPYQHVDNLTPLYHWELIYKLYLSVVWLNSVAHQTRKHSQGSAQFILNHVWTHMYSVVLSWDVVLYLNNGVKWGIFFYFKSTIVSVSCHDLIRHKRKLINLDCSPILPSSDRSASRKEKVAGPQVFSDPSLLLISSPHIHPPPPSHHFPSFFFLICSLCSPKAMFLPQHCASFPHGYYLFLFLFPCSLPLLTCVFVFLST